MRMIYKYQLHIADEQEIQVPKDAKPLCAQIQNGILCVWFETDPTTDKAWRKVRVIGTGNALPSMADYQYLSTVQMPPFVWHIYVERN